MKRDAELRKLKKHSERVVSKAGPIKEKLKAVSRRATAKVLEHVPKYITDDVGLARKDIDTIHECWASLTLENMSRIKDEMCREKVLERLAQYSSLGSDFEKMVEIAEMHLRKTRA